MQFVNRLNYTRCGKLIPKEFEPPTFTPEQNATLGEAEMDRIVKTAELDYGRVDFKRVKLVPFPPKILNPFVYDTILDARIAYIADYGNHCIRRIVVRLANVDTFAGICGEPGFKDGVFTLPISWTGLLWWLMTTTGQSTSTTRATPTSDSLIR